MEFQNAEQFENQYLHDKCIIVSYGVRYNCYCANLSRTLIFGDIDNQIEINYTFMLNLREELLKSLTPGTKLCDVYESCMDYAKKQKEDLIENLPKTFGFAMGIEFRESPELVIGPKCNAIVRKGMVFNVHVGLSGLTNKESSDNEGKTYALSLGDTVVVHNKGPATVLTISDNVLDKLHYYIIDENVDDGEDGPPLMETDSESEPEIEPVTDDSGMGSQSSIE